MDKTQATRDAVINALKMTQALERQLKRNVLSLYYPDKDAFGFHARSKYERHMEFFRLGAQYLVRYAMSGNGVGKTTMGGTECAYHMRGDYPPYWQGHRFDGPIDVWICGDTHSTVREIVQRKLLGEPYRESEGGGIIPVDWIDLDSITRLSQPAGRIDTFHVKHISGGVSRAVLKTYDQGVKTFTGTEQDLIWLDEPPPFDIYSQCLARFRDRPNARMLITATPLDMDQSTRELVRLFLEEPDPSRIVVRMGWADAPHLSEEWKRNQRANTPPYLRNAVEFGDPTRIGGAVYPFLQEQITCEPFTIPRHWRFVYGMDTGFHNTACVWLAIDPDTDVAYVIMDYKDGGTDKNTGEVVDYSIHATRIRAKSKIATTLDLCPGVGDSAAINLKDGSKMIDLYRLAGLDLQLPDKQVTAGIASVTERFANGKLKVFNTCYKLLAELKEYSADDQGRPIKVNDHLCDALRYSVFSGIHIAQSTMNVARQAMLPRVSFG